MNKKAFTVIEIIIVIGLFAGIIGMAMLSRNSASHGSASILTPSHKLYQDK